MREQRGGASGSSAVAVRSVVFAGPSSARLMPKRRMYFRSAVFTVYFSPAVRLSPLFRGELWPYRQTGHEVRLLLGRHVSADAVLLLKVVLQKQRHRQLLPSFPLTAPFLGRQRPRQLRLVEQNLLLQDLVHHLGWGVRARAKRSERTYQWMKGQE